MTGRRNRTHTDFDDDVNGSIERTETYSYDGRRNRTHTDFDDDANGSIDRVAHHDGDSVVRWDTDTDNDGSLDQVRYDGGIDFSGEFPDHAGLEVVHLGGDGGTDLTIPDNFVSAPGTAGGAPGPD